MRNDDPRMMHHPVQGKRDWKSRAVPITVHGDGVRFSMAGNTLLTYQWAVANVLTNWGFESIFHIASWAKVCRAYKEIHGAGNDTWDIMWDYIVLGFNSLFEGTRPALDPYDNPWPANSRQEALAGKDICNGLYFGVVWFLLTTRSTPAMSLKKPISMQMRVAVCAKQIVTNTMYETFSSTHVGGIPLHCHAY